jgi:hypothetical protein
LWRTSARVGDLARRQTDWGRRKEAEKKKRKTTTTGVQKHKFFSAHFVLTRKIYFLESDLCQCFTPFAIRSAYNSRKRRKAVTIFQNTTKLIVELIFNLN